MTMKKIRLGSLLLALLLMLTACGDEFAARDITFHSAYTGYYGFDEAEPYLQAYFKSVETACHQVLNEGVETFALSEAGQIAQQKLEYLQKSGDTATKSSDSTTRLGFLKLFQPYLGVRTQELSVNVSVVMGFTLQEACQALLDELNEAHATYAAAP